MKIELNDGAFAAIAMICFAAIVWAFAWGNKK